MYGPPLIGKTTFVRGQLSHGDVVVDMDALYAPVTMWPQYDKPDNFYNHVVTVHNLLLDNNRTRYGRWHTARIIGGYADKYKRERLANDLGAELIYCDVSLEECLSRLEQDEDRQYRKDDWRGYISKWFESYVE